MEIFPKRNREYVGFVAGWLFVKNAIGESSFMSIFWSKKQGYQTRLIILRASSY